jgi:hypothetical protein
MHAAQRRASLLGTPKRIEGTDVLRSARAPLCEEERLRLPVLSLAKRPGGPAISRAS